MRLVVPAGKLFSVDIRVHITSFLLGFVWFSESLSMGVSGQAGARTGGGQSSVVWRCTSWRTRSLPGARHRSSFHHSVAHWRVTLMEDTPHQAGSGARHSLRSLARSKPW